MLNQCVVAYNLFSTGTNDLFLFSTKEDNKPFIKSFGMFLGQITDVDPKFINIQEDIEILQYLHKI
jgi:hypothetical protein